MLLPENAVGEPRDLVANLFRRIHSNAERPTMFYEVEKEKVRELLSQRDAHDHICEGVGIEATRPALKKSPKMSYDIF